MDCTGSKWTRVKKLDSAKWFRSVEMEEPLAEAMQLPPEVLWDCCGRRLVQRPWALRHRAQTRGLGLEELGIGQWLQVLEAL